MLLNSFNGIEQFSMIRILKIIKRLFCRTSINDDLFHHLLFIESHLWTINRALLQKKKKMKLAPIVLFVYNRIIHTKKVVTALLQNEYASESDLIIYSDGFKNEIIRPEVEAVRDFLNSITGFKSVTIFKRSENWGLANNIIDGVTSVVNQYGKIIVLEDDLLVSRYFLKYMNEALDFYENEKKVISIHGYVYPVRKSLPETFFYKRC